MKKFYILALCCAVALSALALTPQRSKGTPAPTHFLSPKASDNAKKLHPRLAADSPAIRKAPAKSADEMITEPQGEAKSYKQESTGFVSNWFGLTYSSNVLPSEIVWGDNGEVYFKNFISTLESEVYVKGTYADGKITVQLPQICYYEAAEDQELYLWAVVAHVSEEEFDDESYISCINAPAEEQTVVYTVNADGTIVCELNDGDPLDTYTLPEKIIALVDYTGEGEDAWYGYGDAYQSYSEFTDEATTLPEGIELEDWAIISNENRMVKVGFEGDDVYITDMWEYAPEMVAKGRIEGDKVIFPAQYLGEVYGYFAYLMACEWLDEDFMECEMLDEFVMNWDPEAKVMSTDNPMIDLNFNSNKEYYEALFYYENPTIRYQNPDEINAAPEDPYVVYYAAPEYQDWLDLVEGYIEWIIPAMNVNGCMLDTENMYYNFFVDGNVYTFTTEEYVEFDQDYTDVPYDYTDGWDLQVIDESHYFSFRMEDVKSFGLQSFYIGTDGAVYASNPVTYVPESSGIAAAVKELRSAELFDLSGRRVSKAENGIYILRQTFSDGSVSVAKIAR